MRHRLCSRRETLLGHATECTNVGVEEGDVEEEPAQSEKELAWGGTLPSFACMDGNLKFMWKGMGSQLKGSLDVWAVV